MFPSPTSSGSEFPFPWTCLVIPFLCDCLLEPVASPRQALPPHWLSFFFFFFLRTEILPQRPHGLKTHNHPLVIYDKCLEHLPFAS